MRFIHGCASRDGSIFNGQTVQGGTVLKGPCRLLIVILNLIQNLQEIYKGFVYFTARQGITGAQKEIDPKVASYLKEVRKYFKIPIAVGFGISSKERVKQIKPYCEIIVVGSALIDIIEQTNEQNMERQVRGFLKTLL